MSKANQKSGLLKSKKAALTYFSDWAEIYFLILLFIGIILGIFSRNAVITYLIALVSGIFAGKIFYGRKQMEKVTYTLIIVGFILGYIIGAFQGDRRVTFVIFVIAAWGTYYLFNKGYVDKFLLKH